MKFGTLTYKQKQNRAGMIDVSLPGRAYQAEKQLWEQAGALGAEIAHRVSANETRDAQIAYKQTIADVERQLDEKDSFTKEELKTQYGMTDEDFANLDARWAEKDEIPTFAVSAQIMKRTMEDAAELATSNITLPAYKEKAKDQFTEANIAALTAVTANAKKAADRWIQSERNATAEVINDADELRGFIADNDWSDDPQRREVLLRRADQIQAETAILEVVREGDLDTLREAEQYYNNPELLKTTKLKTDDLFAYSSRLGTAINAREREIAASLAKEKDDFQKKLKISHDLLWVSTEPVLRDLTSQSGALLTLVDSQQMELAAQNLTIMEAQINALDPLDSTRDEKVRRLREAREDYRLALNRDKLNRMPILTAEEAVAGMPAGFEKEQLVSHLNYRKNNTEVFGADLAVSLGLIKEEDLKDNNQRRAVEDFMGGKVSTMATTKRQAIARGLNDPTLPTTDKLALLAELDDDPYALRNMQGMDLKDKDFYLATMRMSPTARHEALTAHEKGTENVPGLDYKTFSEEFDTRVGDAYVGDNEGYALDKDAAWLLFKSARLRGEDGDDKDILRNIMGKKMNNVQQVWNQKVLLEPGLDPGVFKRYFEDFDEAELEKHGGVPGMSPSLALQYMQELNMVSTPHGYRWSRGTYDEQGREHMLMGKDGKPFTVPYDRSVQDTYLGRKQSQRWELLKNLQSSEVPESDVEPGGA